MGNYEDAIREFLDHTTATPDIIRDAAAGTPQIRIWFELRAGDRSASGRVWPAGRSDGRNESYAYTEDDRTLELGGFAQGSLWHRRDDRAGIAFVANGIVAAHQEYLALAGWLRFSAMEGSPTGREKILEAFYTAHLWRGFFASYDLQYITIRGITRRADPPLFQPSASTPSSEDQRAQGTLARHLPAGAGCGWVCRRRPAETCRLPRPAWRSASLRAPCARSHRDRT